MQSEASTAGANQGLARMVEELKRELAEAHQREAATADVLKVIRRSPNELQPVLNTVLQTAARLCEAELALFFKLQDGTYHLVGANNAAAVHVKYLSEHPINVDRGSLVGRTALERHTVHLPDCLADPEYTRRDEQRVGKYRSMLGVPLLREGVPIGIIGLQRTVVEPFTAKQIELVETFADQAVIAIENTRLFEEVQARNRELIETGEILRVISSSPTNTKPVFDTIVRSAVNLCDAVFSAVALFDGELLHLAAHLNYTPEGARLAQLMYPRRPDRRQMLGRAVLEGAPVQVEDALADPEYAQDLARAGAWRGLLGVPMLRDRTPIGAICVMRAQPGPFSPIQVKLLQTFADQAVIAIENTRLFEAEQASKRELQESLEYQTATSEVLNVISRSPTELQPVLDAIAATAARLCESMDATVWRVAGGRVKVVAQFGSPTSSDHPLTRGTVTGRAIVDRKTIHVHDLAAMVETEYPEAKEIQQRTGHRTTLATPLLSQGEALGAISVRKNHVHPFSDRQIALLQTFADQAVIAIENARLFEAEQARKRELQESLEYQTATSDVLSVISRSPSDLQPVLNTLVASAARLCDAEMVAIHIRHDDTFPGRARYGVPAEMVEALSRIGQVMGRGSLVGRTIAEGRPVHIPDAAADLEYTNRDFTRITGARSMLGVPLLRDGGTVGLLSLYRTRVSPFTERQIELMATFADQAVIAIENTRLFEEVQARTRELTGALDQQTSLAKVLSVISATPGKVHPVFDAILEEATRLCEAQFGVLHRFDGTTYIPVGVRGDVPELLDHFRSGHQPSATNALGRILRTKEPVHLPDAREGPGYKSGDSAAKAVVEVGGARSYLLVPLLKDQEVIGAITIFRQEVRPFSEKQIQLLSSFGNQAVIAIENTRLFDEVQTRTRELARSVEELKALAGVGQAVSSSLELKVVLPRILEHACALSDTGGGAIYVFDKARGQFGLEAGLNMSEDLVAAVREHPIRVGESLVGQCAERRETVQIQDLSKAPPHPLYEMHMKVGVCALLAVPLLHQDEVVGALVVRRMHPGAFATETVGLLQSLASQSAIAIQNAGLFEEIARKSRELEIASQHKSQFVANMSHELRTPLAAILGYAELMQEGFYEPLGQKSMDALTRIRSNGKHLLGLINTVLDIAKIESGQFNLNLGEFALDSVVETVRAATEALAESKKLSLKTEVAKSLPIGLGDEQRLTQVLLNLVGNAIKFTDAGEVRIAATAVNGHFEVTVADTGPGIPPEHQARVFEQFHQVDSSNTKAKGGTGLGLAIAKQIVEMHGGRIWVESSVGKGSTFRIDLPVRAAKPTAAS
jgi:GAF domain-containing protein/anti-sigma regulatory factor (Ser/Thr protein kinase)